MGCVNQNLIGREPCRLRWVRPHSFIKGVTRENVLFGRDLGALDGYTQDPRLLRSNARASGFDDQFVGLRPLHEKERPNNWSPRAGRQEIEPQENFNSGHV